MFLSLQSMPRSDGNLTIGSVSIFIAFLLLVVGAVLVAVYKSKKNVHKSEYIFVSCTVLVYFTFQIMYLEIHKIN